MEPIDDDPFEPSSSKNQKVEANDLLEECWFFDNLLIRKQRMVRCYSDPCCPSSSSFGREMLVKNSDAKSSLVRTPSLPLHVGREEKVQQAVKQSTPKKSERKLTRQTSHQKMLQTPTKSPPCVGRKEESKDREDDGRRSKTNEQSVHRSLLRTPSLPPCLGKEERNQESVLLRHKVLIILHFMITSHIIGTTKKSLCTSIYMFNVSVRVSLDKNFETYRLRPPTRGHSSQFSNCLA